MRQSISRSQTPQQVQVKQKPDESNKVSIFRRIFCLGPKATSKSPTKSQSSVQASLKADPNSNQHQVSNQNTQLQIGLAETVKT
eukprot:403366414